LPILVQHHDIFISALVVIIILILVQILGEIPVFGIVRNLITSYREQLRHSESLRRFYVADPCGAFFPNVADNLLECIPYGILKSVSIKRLLSESLKIRETYLEIVVLHLAAFSVLEYHTGICLRFRDTVPAGKGDGDQGRVAGVATDISLTVEERSTAPDHIAPSAPQRD
jgi:hypothetical protein